MTFDKSKVYTALNADELKVGSKVYVSDSMYYLKKCVEDNLESCILTEVLLEKEANRFCIDDMINEQWQLAYLIEPPAGSKYKPFENVDTAMEAIKEHGGWVENRNSGTQYIVTAKDREYGLFLLGYHWYSLGDLFQRFIFADDGSPCGELADE